MLFILMLIVILLLLILPLYIGIFVVIFRFKNLIKAMTEFNEFLDCVTKEGSHEQELNKREYLKTRIKEGQALPGKTPWTEERSKQSFG